MIRLTKGPVPNILKLKSVEWTRELVAAGQDLKAKAARYSHREIKAALIEETRGKCAYCESKILHVSYGDVEHIIAKSTDPLRTYEWLNLTIACDKCNTNKGVKEGILDPYMTDPASALDFAGPWVGAAIGSELGRVTVVALDLNRAELLERRKEKIDALRDRVEAILSVSDLERRRFLLDALIEDAIDPKTEYSAVLSEHVNQLQQKGYVSRAA